MTATAAPPTVTGREVGAAKLLVRFHRIEGQVTPGFVTSPTPNPFSLLRRPGPLPDTATAGPPRRQ